MTNTPILLLALFLSASRADAAAPLPAAQSPSAPASVAVTGAVRDAGGGVVTGAVVVLRLSSGAERQAKTGSDGKFTVTAAASGDVILIVRASGFAEFRRTIQAASEQQSLEVTLEPAGISEAVTVTPTRSEQRLGDVPASINVITSEDIKLAPAVVADDVLQQIPTFSLFRRSSSLSAHPTSQGVSLRGIGPSGVSRTLVLLDGVPFNDAFGGWVYWTGVPLEGAERIEVVDSASSSLYGTYAMGGVINIVTAKPTPKTFELRTQYGTRQTPKLDFRAANVWRKVGVAVDGSLFDTDGYPTVVDVNPAGVAERGAIDNNATVNFKNFSVKLDYDPSDRLHAFVRTGYFREKRDNGKISTFAPFTEEGNDTSWYYTSGGIQTRLADSSTLQATMFVDDKTFDSNFLAVPASTPPRSIGRMTLNQRVPATAVGGMVQWSRTFGRHSVSVGGDYRWVDGDSVEDALDAVTGTTVTLHRVSGGTQRNVGAFVQDVISASTNLTITLSARVDAWRNYDGHNTETALATGAVTDPAIADRDDTVGSPRVGAHYRITDRVSVWGDVGTGFRAPTLNELYRQFRVGMVLTLANPDLGPEHLVGGEAGVSLIPTRNLTVRSTWYDNRVKDPVSNVTISTVGTNVTQRRQNLGRTRIWGIQTDAEYRLGASWRFSAGYLFNQAKVTENVNNPSLVGLYLAQVPKHRGSVQIQYANPRIASVAFEVQGIGNQFDDDTNTRAVPGITEPGLPPYGLVSLSVSRALTPNVEVFGAAQNLFDQEYFVGTLPTLVGPPRLVSAGVRVRFRGR
jgi:outer membrane receptor protein involved in Fe transport